MILFSEKNIVDFKTSRKYELKIFKLKVTFASPVQWRFET